MIGAPELVVVLAMAVVPIAVFYGARTLWSFYQRQQRAIEALERGGAPVASTASDAETRSVTVRAGAILQPNDLFASRYRIKRVLGRGGMGVVYEAWDNELESPVALKLILPEILGDPGKSESLTQRLKQELQLARRVTHRNVLRIHDIGDAAGAKYITMPFVEGTDLAAVLREAPLPVDRAVAIWRQAVEGLVAAHEEQVVHRDLKPQNILVGAGDRVFVSDFGLAKSLAPGGAELTQTGQVHCTPRYVAPEQLEGKPADPRSDLYALGLILYEMLTGDIPFAGNSPTEIMFARLGPAPADPRTRNAAVPQGLGRIVLRCLEKDPERRYQTARQLLTDLDGVPVVVA